jgi:hypothetical protein
MTGAEFDRLHVGDDTCLDLVYGLLDVETRCAALAHLEACSECARRLQETAASHARAEAVAASVLGAKRTADPRRAERETRDRAVGMTRHDAVGMTRHRSWLLAAAGIAALVGITWIARDRTALDPPPVEDAAARLPAARLRGAIRGLSLAAGDSLIVTGLDAYNRRDYAAARAALETAGRAGRMENVRRIYLASTLLELDDAAGAADALRDVDLRWVPEPWKSEARWTLATALTRTGHFAVADSLFDFLAREEGPVADRARARRATHSPSH